MNGLSHWSRTDIPGSEASARVRRAELGDERAIAAVHVASWHYAYDGLLPESVSKSQTVSKRESFWGSYIADLSNWPVVVLETDKGINGFASAIPARDRDVDSSTVSELAAIYLHSTACSKCFGTVLLRCCWEEALSRNYTKMILWILENNEKALSFYRKFGFEHDGTSKYEVRFGANEIRLDISIPN